jgi:hypothetical protein
MRKCYKCFIEGEDTLFKLDYKYKPPKPSNICIQCNVKDNKKYRQLYKELYNKKAKERRNERKLRAIEYKGNACEHCKQSFHPAAFDFHHLDPKQKDRDPGLMMSASDETLFKELDKCILLCSNCHRIYHFKNGY